MKDLFQLFLCCLSFFYTLGCSNRGDYYDPGEFYSLTDTLRGEILAVPLDSYAGLYYNDYGILAATRVDNGIFQLLDSLDASKITVAGRRGRGPDEFLMAMAMQYDRVTNRFSAFDLYKQEMVTYLVSPDTISLVGNVHLKRDLQSVNYINDSLLVFINFYPDQKIGLINTGAEVIYEEEYNTLDDDRIKTGHAYHSVDMSVSPDKNYIGVADGRFPAILIYRNTPNGFELKWKKILFKPLYDFNSEKKWYKFREEHYAGFRSLYLSDKYIYLSCDDTQIIDIRRKAPKQKHTYLLVMDYDGNIVNKYLLDKFVSDFTLSPDERSLYAVIDDPDYLIAKYKLRPKS